MARYLIQSTYTWQFLHGHPLTGDVQWTPALTTALRFGVAESAEQVAQLIEDHCDAGEVCVVELDVSQAKSQ